MKKINTDTPTISDFKETKCERIIISVALNVFTTTWNGPSLLTTEIPFLKQRQEQSTAACCRCCLPSKATPSKSF